MAVEVERAQDEAAKVAQTMQVEVRNEAQHNFPPRAWHCCASQLVGVLSWGACQ